MGQGISIREFARREGVSDTLVRKAVKLGRLKAFDDKSMDPALVGTSWCESNAKGANTPANPTANPPSRGLHPKVDVASKNLAGQLQDGESLAAAAKRIAEQGDALYDYAEALRRKENYLALLRQLEYEVKSGTLIELAAAKAVFFDDFRAQRDAWLNWPTRVGPLLAADLGLEADRVTDALTAHVHKQIADLGEPGVDLDGGKN
ncbi:MAG: hypothetical protein EPN62_08725 [Candidimonas sp.]|nr:MAG: hypothetical protein EPN77_05960 [Candidimonas sp.]TAM23750.1 MAG: hypothetical protein EPN62_08725 [Candidimonas sp.]